MNRSPEEWDDLWTERAFESYGQCCWLFTLLMVSVFVNIYLLTRCFK